MAISGMIFEMSGLQECTQGYTNLIGLCAYTPQYSGLWRAFAVPLPFGKHSAIVAGYCAIIFFYLAGPLLRTIASQLRLLWRGITSAQGVRALWRFRF